MGRPEFVGVSRDRARGSLAVGAADDDVGEADDGVGGAVATALFAEDEAVLAGWAGLGGDRLVEVGIERLTNGFDGGDAATGEGILQAAVGVLEAVDEALDAG